MHTALDQATLPVKLDAEQRRLLNQPTRPANVLVLDLHVGAGTVTVESG